LIKFITDPLEKMVVDIAGLKS